MDKNTPRATHAGPLTISGITIPCAVLDDGTRVLSRQGVLRAMGRTGNPKGGENQLFQLPTFLRADNLKDFITEELISSSTPILFRAQVGGSKAGTSYGYRAELLPLICNAFLDAQETGALRANQLHIYERCKILSRGFAIVGITALVDEATGYQYVRDRLALQAILDRFLRKELAAWAKRFPDEFYAEMFRLKGWDLKSAAKRPGVVGRYTNDLVYERLTPRLLEELEKKNPKDEKGNRKGKHHQWFTDDIGHPALNQHLYAIVGFMRACTTWEQFYRMVQRAYPRFNTTLLLPIPEPTDEE